MYICSFCFRVTPKTKIYFVEIRFCVKIPVSLNFYVVFPGVFENYFKFLPPECTNYIHFPIQQDAVEENRSDFTAPIGGDRHKNKSKIIKTHIIVKSIHSSVRSESNISKMPSIYEKFQLVSSHSYDCYFF